MQYILTVRSNLVEFYKMQLNTMGTSELIYNGRVENCAVHYITLQNITIKYG